MAGYVLVLAVLLLGGVIATIGDRLGTKVGKARLSLWGMRPRKTAVAITILTGAVISATTLGILFALSEQLRTGVFELESIQKKLRRAREELDQTRQERQQIEQERDEARSEQVVAQQRLKSTRNSLDAAISRQKQTETQLGTVAKRAVALRNEAERLQQEQQALIRQRDAVVVQIEQRNQEIAKRDRDIAQQEKRLSSQDSRIAKQNRAIQSQRSEIEKQQSDLDSQRTEIAERDEQIVTQRQLVAQGKAQLKELEQTQEFLDQAIRQREQELVQLRQGNVAITRGEALATRILRVIVPSATDRAVDILLQEANQAALQRLSPGVEGNSDVPTIQITQAEVDRVRREIEDGQEYVVRILAAGNYVRGEKNILVFTDVVPNKIIFEGNITLATTSISPDSMDSAQIRERISLLIEASLFRAQRAGIISDQTLVGDDGVASLVQFYERVLAEGSFLSLQAVTSRDIYTAGPLRIHLVALRDGEELFRTGVAPENRPPQNRTPEARSSATLNSRRR